MHRARRGRSHRASRMPRRRGSTAAGRTRRITGDPDRRCPALPRSAPSAGLRRAGDGLTVNPPAPRALFRRRIGSSRQFDHRHPKRSCDVVEGCPGGIALAGLYCRQGPIGQSSVARESFLRQATRDPKLADRLAEGRLRSLCLPHPSETLSEATTRREQKNISSPARVLEHISGAARLRRRPRGDRPSLQGPVATGTVAGCRLQEAAPGGAQTPTEGLTKRR